MTRFLYIADTHLGAAPMGYQQQPGYPEKLPEIVAALREYLSATGGVDFILHGGDMVDATTNDNLTVATELFALPCPVYLSLGNHDLTTRDAIDSWLSLAPQFFKDRAPDYTVDCQDCVIHVATNQWCETPYYWESAQSPHFLPEQVEKLEDGLNQRPELPHFLVTHCPVHGLPPEQTGLPDPLHAPDAVFTAVISGLAENHPNLKCILGAHNHMNMRISRADTEFITVSALVETPFEFKRFDLTPEKIAMSTIQLAPGLKFEAGYDGAKGFVQGRSVDRAAVVNLQDSPGKLRR